MMSSQDPRTTGAIAEGEASIPALIEALHEADQQLTALTAGEVDAVSNRAGRTVLLQDAQERLREYEVSKQAAILDALPANIALLDARGSVVSVNAAWSRLAQACALAPPHDGANGVGFEVCSVVAGGNAALAQQVTQAIRSVLAGDLKTFSVEYPHQLAGQAPCWFLLTISPFAGPPPIGAVVMHLDITERTRAEQSRQRTSELLSAVAAGTSDQVFVKGSDGRYLFCNESFARFAGRSVEEMVGQDNGTVFGAEAARALTLTDRRVIETGESLSTEELLAGAAGPRIFHATKGPYRDVDGAVIGVIGISRDITDRKNAEQALSESQTLLSLAGRLAVVGSWVVNLPAQGVVWSNALALMHDEAEGFSPTPEQALAYYAPEHRDSISAVFARCIRTGEPFDVEHEIVTARGRRLWVRTIGEAVLDEAGHVVRIQGALQDLSERIAAERATAQLAARLTNTLESITEGFVTLDHEWRFTYVNHEASRMTGQSRESLLGRVLWDALPALVGSDFEREYRQAMGSGRATTFEALYAPWSTWMAVRCYPSEAGLSINFSDVTQQRLDQNALRELNADLEARVVARTAELKAARDEADQANRAKSSFLASMSHEIRTPMNGVIGMIDVLEQGSLRPAQAEIVRTVRESAYALLHIVDDVLDFSKIEAGHLQIDCEPMSIAQVVEGVCDTLEHLSHAKGVTLQQFIDPLLPDQVLGDAMRLRQILLNLLGNAIKFSSADGRSGQVVVRATQTAREADRASIELSVSDNGIGMDDATLKRLFKPFTQADDSTTRRFGGTGLGLSICSRLAGLMGGDIQVTSTPGVGSRFALGLTLPALDHDSSVPASPSRLADVCCLVLGTQTGVAPDLAQDLKRAGADVHAAASLPAADRWFATAAAASGTAPRTSRVVVIDALGTLADAGQRATAQHHWSVLRQAAVPVLLIDACPPAAVPLAAEGGGPRVSGSLLRAELIDAVALAAGLAPTHGADAASTFEVETLPAEPTLRHAVGRSDGSLILVAEDNDINRKVIRKQLALLGYTADIVRDGREALARARRGRYALLLTDLHMPLMDGYELANAIRKEEASGVRMPIVALTANALKGEARRCRDNGMDDYMTKPVQLADLHAMLVTWMPAHAKPTALRRRMGEQRSSPHNDPPPRSVPAAPAVDLGVLAALVGDDPAVIGAMLDAFATSAARSGAAIRQGVATAAHSTVGDAAHSLKSAARSIGARRLGTLCDEMETAALAGRTPELAVQLEHFEIELGRVTRFLEAR